MTGTAEDAMQIVIIVLMYFVRTLAAVAVERRTAIFACARHLFAPKKTQFGQQSLVSPYIPHGALLTVRVSC